MLKNNIIDLIMNIYSNIENILFLFFLYKLFNVYNRFNVISNVRRLLYEGVLFVDDDLFDDLEKELEEKEQKEKEQEEKGLEEREQKEKAKREMKYEDKYLEEVRKMSNEYVFTDDEVKLTKKMYTEFYENALNQIRNSKEVLQSKIKEKQYELNDLRDMINDSSSSSSSDDDVTEEILIKEIDELNSELQVLNEKIITKEEIEEQVKKDIIEKRLDNLKNCFVIEKTPLGNVAMIYNNKKSSFEYFSDNTIPYRYLEPVSRKYVLTFRCKTIYVDMEEELKESERKLEEKEKEKKERELMKIEEKENEKINKNFIPVPVKKNVFAKFKNYNKEAGSGRVNMVPPPKNSIPSGVKKEANPNEKVLLKERANRYSCEGRFSNFSIIQKVDRKKVDKKFAMTFADFKKMNKK
jgi:ribosomal protein L19E